MKYYCQSGDGTELQLTDSAMGPKLRLGYDGYWASFVPSREAARAIRKYLKPLAKSAPVADAEYERLCKAPLGVPVAEPANPARDALLELAMQLSDLAANEPGVIADQTYKIAANMAMQAAAKL